VFFLSLLLAACGGSKSIGSQPETPNLNGYWQFSLDYNQAKALADMYPASHYPDDGGVTEFALGLSQSGSVVVLNGNPLGNRVGCSLGYPSYSAGWVSPGWTTAPGFNLESATGTMVNHAFILNAFESVGGYRQPLEFTGMLGADGALDGVVVDSCGPDSVPHHWHGVRIPKLPSL
jgi:hypothetical protein